MFGNIYRDLFDAVSDGVFYVNLKREIEYWNAGAENLTGLSFSAVKGRLCDNVLAYEDEAGTALADYEYPPIACMQSSNTVVKNLCIKHANGERPFVEVLASPVMHNGRPAGAVCIMRDNKRVFQAVEAHLKSHRRERLIPICAWCKKIRMDDDSWEQIEKYLTDEGVGVFTHGMCPDCADKIFEKKLYMESYQGICKAISSSLSLEEVLTLVVTNAVKVMNVKASMLRLLNRESQQLEVAAHYGLSDVYVKKGPVQYDKSIEDALTGKAVSVYDITSDTDAKYREEAEKEGIRSILSIPVKFKKEVIGVLRMYTSEPVKYKEEDLKFMTAIAEQAAIAIVNARTFETTVSHAREYLRVFEEVTKVVSSSLRLNEVLYMIVRKLPEAMDLKGATIRFLDETGRTLIPVAAFGLSEKYLGKGPVDMEENIRSALQRGPVAIFDVSSDPRIIYQKEAVEEGIKSMLTLPIVAYGKVIGILRLFTAKPRLFSEEDIAFSVSLAEVCGTAIENARMYEQLHKQSVNG